MGAVGGNVPQAMMHEDEEDVGYFGIGIDN